MNIVQQPSANTAEIVSAVTSVLPSVQLIVLFGSIARGQARVDSDVDIAVLSGKAIDAVTRLALIEELALKTGRSVDLVDLVTVGEPLLGNILREGMVLLDTNHHRGNLLVRHLGNVEDFIPLQELILRTRRQAWTGQ